MSMSAGSVLRRLRDTAREETSRIEIPRTGHLDLAQLLWQVASHSRKDALLAFAGNLTYNAFLALFPFLLFLVSLLKMVHATGLITDLVDTVTRTLPHQAAHLVRQQMVQEVLSRLTNNPLLSISLALGSLWAASFVARAIVQAINRMYGVEDRRPFWQRFLLPLLLSVGAAILFLAALGLIVFGANLSVAVGSALGSGSAGWWAWAILRWPLLLALAFLAFAVIYHWSPDIQPRTPFLSVGTVLGTVAWLVFSAAFSLVLNHFAQFLISPLYGWFTGLIVLLMYMYWSSVLLLVGAEINRVIAEHIRSCGQQQTPSRRR